MKWYAIFFALLLIGCQPAAEPVNETVEPEQEYSDELLNRINRALSNETAVSRRPNYLPEIVYKDLPPFPEDFYQVRTLVRLGTYGDLSEIEEEYWLQPEFFPKFEDLGVPLLQDPPKGRWGAYGIAVYPADTVVAASPGDEFSAVFFLRSNYLVETYQGINLVPAYPTFAEITTGAELPNGEKSVRQDPQEVKDYFEVTSNPELMLLEPNFPIFSKEGTQRINITVKIAEDAKPGSYVVGLDTGAVPVEQEKLWIREYLNLYTDGELVKIGRPYYQMFVTVTE